MAFRAVIPALLAQGMDAARLEAKRIWDMTGTEAVLESHLEVLSETNGTSTGQGAPAAPRPKPLSVQTAPEKSKMYAWYPHKACFPGRGAVPLEANHDGDHELPGWPTYDVCKKACDEAFKCKAFTRKMGATGQCWLRENVNLHACPDEADVETHAQQEVVDDDRKCAAHGELACAEAVGWAFVTGKHESWATETYGHIQNVAGVGLHAATVEDVQRLFYCGAVAKAKKCELPPCTCSKPPCDTCGNFVAATPPPRKGPSERIVHAYIAGKKPLGYKGRSDCWVGQAWCEAQCPSHEFSLNVGCDSAHKSLEVNVLSYNLFWWHLFGKRGGANRMAGRLVEKTGPWDFIGFQECDSMETIMRDSGILGSHQNYNGTAAVTIAWEKSGWITLSTGFKYVSEDSPAQYYGMRTLVYARLIHRQTKKTVLFLTFHGALPVNGDGGGRCGGEATAYNILRVISEEAEAGDAVILVGDFNAGKGSHLLNVLSRHLKHEYQGRSFNGVDNFFTNRCVDKVSARNLGNGGSDHDALGVTFRI